MCTLLHVVHDLTISKSAGGRRSSGKSQSTPSNATNQISSAVIEDLKSVCAADKSYRLAYFYFTFRDPQTQSTITCLSSILHQICPSAEIPKDLETLYDNCEKESRRAPTLSEIRSLLTSRIQEIKKLFIVLDALDECPNDIEGLQRAQILEWILAISATHPNVQLLFTSRNDPGASDIADVVRSHPKLIEVAVDTTKTHDDICLHLSKQFDSNRKLRKMNENSTVDIPAVLLEKAGGM